MSTKSTRQARPQGGRLEGCVNEVKAGTFRFRREASRAWEVPGKETPTMKEQSTERLIESRPSWEEVEAFARQAISSGSSGCWKLRWRSCWGGRVTRGVRGSTRRPATATDWGSRGG